MKSDIKNVKLGVCRVIWNGVDLGYTKGGVDVTVKTETHKVLIDQFGKTPINEYVMGRECTVKAPLAETTTDNMLVVMPGAFKVVDSTDPTKVRVEVPSGVGANLLDFAYPLILRPMGKADGDRSDDFVLHRTATPGSLSFSFKLEDERVFSTEFSGYPDTAGSVFSVGDFWANSTVITVDSTTDLVTDTDHGFVAGDRVTFGAVGSSSVIPGGMVEGKVYYVIATGLTANSFNVSATAGGTVVDFTSNGTGTTAVRKL